MNRYTYCITSILILFLFFKGTAQEFASIQESPLAQLSYLELINQSKTDSDTNVIHPRLVKVFPEVPVLLVGQKIHVMVGSTSQQKIQKHHWKDLKTGTASRYSLKNTHQSVLLIDGTGAQSGSIHLEYVYYDVQNRPQSRRIEAYIYDQDKGDLFSSKDAIHMVPAKPKVFFGHRVETRKTLNVNRGKSSIPYYEDGIMHPESIERGKEITFHAKVFNQTGKSAHLTGFIDWNMDGKFTGPHEVASISVSGDLNYVVPIKFRVPESAPLHSSIPARFRISTDRSAVMTCCNLAKDGEVEDYFIQVSN